MKGDVIYLLSSFLQHIFMENCVEPSSVQHAKDMHRKDTVSVTKEIQPSEAERLASKKVKSGQ